MFVGYKKYRGKMSDNLIDINSNIQFTAKKPEKDKKNKKRAKQKLVINPDNDPNDV